MEPVVIGTAGHIDHGKSSLVRALTGTDPDRLAEEQERGMTIDLGFAFLSENIAFIDVPGHERFVKNMVAGVSTVDYAMLVIAADDGVMPQTREHLDILNLLQLKQGLVVINKIDLVDAELLALVEQEIQEIVKGSFLQKAPLFKVSAITGQGLDVLRSYLLTLPEKTLPRPDRGFFWMPVDRSFSMKGFGTVVTGTVLSGQTTVGETLELLPDSRAVKVRGIQSHGKSMQQVGLGRRAAINLQNITREEIERGHVLASAGRFKASPWMDVRLTLLPHAPRPLAQRTRVRIHLGTRELLGRVKLLEQSSLQPGQSGYAQLLLEEPALAMRRDAFVIRQYSPAMTIGGGIVLETNPPLHKRHDEAVLQQLAGMEKLNPAEVVLGCLAGHAHEPAPIAAIHQWSGLAEEKLHTLMEQLLAEKSVRKMVISGKPLFISDEMFVHLKNRLTQTLATFHEREPLRPGMNKAEWRLTISGNLHAKLFEMAVQELKNDQVIEEQPGWIRLAGYQVKLGAADQETAAAMEKLFAEHPFTPPDEKELTALLKKPEAEIRRVLGALQAMGRLLRLEGDLFFTIEAVNEMKRRLRQFSSASVEISVGQFREMLSTSRKYAVPLLNYLDQQRITERVGDGRVIDQEALQLAVKEAAAPKDR